MDDEVDIKIEEENKKRKKGKNKIPPKYRSQKN